MLVYWKGLGPGGRGTARGGCRSRARPGCWRSSACSPRSRRSGPRGRPPRWRAWCPPRAAPIGATPTPARGSATATTRSAPASIPNRSGSPRARSTWRPTGPASTTPSTRRTASRSSPRSMEKMIALGPQDVGEQKERPAENLQAGREFAAVRRKPEPRPRRPGERAAKALVYVKGPTPLHLPLTAYSHFDGTTWREEPCCNRHFPAEPEPRSTWLRLPWCEAPFLAGIVAHQVKIGTLESSPMPVPSHLTRFRVGSVNRLDFFGWAQFGIIRMTDRTVPAGTVIDSEARTVDPRAAEVDSVRGPAGQRRRTINCRSTAIMRSDPAVAALAKRWVGGPARGVVPGGGGDRGPATRATPTTVRRRLRRTAPTSSPSSCCAPVAAPTTCSPRRRSCSSGRWVTRPASSAACTRRRGSTTPARGTRR